MCVASVRIRRDFEHVRGAGSVRSVIIRTHNALLIISRFADHRANIPKNVATMERNCEMKYLLM